VNDRFDIAIVGGGIAGSSLAAVLARAGLGVLLIERESVFRDRVRGEGIHPWGVAEAHRIGLDPVLAAANANRLPIWQRYKEREPQEPFRWAEVSVDGLPEMAVHHPYLQQASIEAAVEAGAALLRPANVTAFRGGSNPELDIASDGSTRTIRARLIVGAGGRASPARHWTGGQSKHDPVHHRIGGALLGGVALAEDTAHEATFPGGRTFVMPQGDGRARAYVVTAADRNRELQHDHTGEVMIAFLAELLPQGLFEQATKAGPVAFFPNADTWASTIAGDGIVLIGDAAGANDPSVGQGLSLVFRDVRELSDLLLAGDNWHGALVEFAERRRDYFDVLREHAKWLGVLVTEEGLEADARRERVELAREEDPSAGGFSLIFARGPDGLVADERSRRRFFGETETR
jgi:2-polyprenyl-6-methoxyphenol hydroxylase-like FAD-dependent oxidoreductase